MSDGYAGAGRWSAREWGVLLVLAAVQFTAVVDFMIIMPLGPLVNKELSLTPARFGAVVSAYAFAAGLVGLLAASHIDRFDRRKALVVVYAGFTTATLLCGLAPEFWSLVAARAVAGAFGGLLGALVFSVVGDTFPEARRGSATGIVMAAFGVATVAGVPAGLEAARQFTNWRAPFLFLAAGCLPVLTGAWVLLPPCRRHLDGPARPRVSLLGVLRKPRHLWALALMAALVFGGFTVIPYISIYLVNNVGLTQAQLVYVYFAGGGVTLVSMPLLGRLADRYGKRVVFRALAVGSLVPVVLLTHLPAGSPLVAVLVVTTAFMALMSGRGVPATALVTSAAVPAERGAFLSLNSSAQQLAAGLAVQLSATMLGTPADPAMAGSAPLEGYATVGYVATAFSLLGVVVVSGVRPADAPSIAPAA
jgi:predicted MFS family arabinose efflux permease